MKIIDTALPGVLLFEPATHHDERGFLLETFRESWLAEAGLHVAFVQENQSRSQHGVLRGLHYQLENPQGKLVRTARGKVFDVVVDVRRGSPHFGQWTGVELDDVSHRQLWIPAGFAHGFCVLSEEADVVYKCSEYFHPASGHGIAWNDPEIGIAWPQAGPWLLSAKDRSLPHLSQVSADALPLYRG